MRYLFRGVMVGDGHRRAGTPLCAAQDEAGVPPGVWKGRGLAALGLTAGDVVIERQAELLLGEGRHPDDDRIERELLAQGKSPEQVRRATVLRRPIEHNRSPKTDKARERTPWLAFDLVFRPPPTAHIAWALMDDRHRLVLEMCDDIARDKTLAWVEESVAQIRWKAGGKQRARVKDGLIVAVFRHYESRATESRPLLHAHAIVSIRARRPHEYHALVQFASVDANPWAAQEVKFSANGPDGNSVGFTVLISSTRPGTVPGLASPKRSGKL